VAGALEESAYRAKLSDAGFDAINIEPWRVYRVNDARDFLLGVDVEFDAIAPLVGDKFASAFILAQKPKGCCGPTCCAS
jgi:arsenite methyltransferase